MRVQSVGILVFLVIMLLPIQSVQACSYVLPKTLHLRYIHRAEDPNRPIIKIYNNTKYVTDAVFDIENQKLSSQTKKDKKANEDLPGSLKPYTSILTFSIEQIHWVLEDTINGSNILDIIIPIGINHLVSHTYFISKRLNRVYLFIYTEYDKAITAIFSLDDSSLITLNKNTSFRCAISQHVYDEKQIGYFYLNSWDCIAGVYYHYNDTSIGRIAKYFLWESYYLDQRSNKLISLNPSTGVKIINYETNEITEFNIGIEDIKRLIYQSNNKITIQFQPYLVLLALITIIFIKKLHYRE